MRISLKETRLGLLNSTTRIALRYGNACLTRCPQAVMGVMIEAAGKRQAGYSGDCLPPGWFDKSPAKDYAQQIDEMLAVIALSERAFLDAFTAPTEFFPAWRSAYEHVHDQAAEYAWPLLASFGISMVERAILDAIARAAGLSFFEAVRTDLYGIDPGQIHPVMLSGWRLADGLATQPRRSVFVRHTVGLADPLTPHDVAEHERLNDGFPQTLEEYVQHTGLRYFKIKVSSTLDDDLDRLTTIASVIERYRGNDYHVTLDGNEQYKSADDFRILVDAVQNTPSLRTLWNNTLAIEQPLDRAIALAYEHTQGIRELGPTKAVIIDESDETLDAYPKAIALGYRGTSSKSCKGPGKSMINACLTRAYNQQAGRQAYLMTGEDLCAVGIVPVQSDLCLVAALGLEHVERNGHHYHLGLSYVPDPQRRAALEAHPDFYTAVGDTVAPRLVDGRFEISSLQCVGCGFAVEPDFGVMQSVEE